MFEKFSDISMKQLLQFIKFIIDIILEQFPIGWCQFF